MGNMLMESRTRSTEERFYGVVVGTVIDNLDPQEQGRIKVKLQDFGIDSEWCQVSFFYAGNGYGSFFVPEIGDQVLVAFNHGDMLRPIILGSLYNDKDKPPTERTADKDQKMIRTKGKHEFLMDDTPSKEKVQLKTKGEHELLMDETPGKEKVQLKTKGGHTVLLDDVAKKVTVKTNSGQEVLLEDAGGKVTIKTSGGQSITMDASGIKLTATTITLAGTSLNLGEGAAMSLVLGEAFMTAFNTHTHNCTAPGTPSGPPVPPLTPAVLSKVSKTN